MLQYKHDSLGLCPHCNSENLKYGERTLEDNIFTYSFTCEDCKTTGDEFYTIEYIKTAFNPPEQKNRKGQKNGFNKKDHKSSFKTFRLKNR